MISLERVSKSFDDGRSFAVDDVSLDVREGETLVLLGSSGSGKTTLLKLTNRLLEPTAGTIEVDGDPEGGWVEVYTGLDAGDVVLVPGRVASIREGQRVIEAPLPDVWLPPYARPKQTGS